MTVGGHRRPVDTAAYIEELQERPCFICGLVAGDPRVQGRVVFEDEDHIVFLPRRFVQRGYVIVAPRKHVENLVVDVSVDEHLCTQSLVHRVAGVLRTVVPTERVYVFSLGSQQGNAHVHWHIVALPPDVPLERQQFAAVIPELAGVLELDEDEIESIAAEVEGQLAVE